MICANFWGGSDISASLCKVLTFCVNIVYFECDSILPPRQMYICVSFCCINSKRIYTMLDPQNYSDKNGNIVSTGTVVNVGNICEVICEYVMLCEMWTRTTLWVNRKVSFYFKMKLHSWVRTFNMYDSKCRILEFQLFLSVLTTA
jgi:hypothetical protein